MESVGPPTRRALRYETTRGTLSIWWPLFSLLQGPS
jgi:hypothetical protein